MRDITIEKSNIQTGTGKASSSHKALSYNLISPYFIRRLAQRMTVGGVKYGSVQWRQGINDTEYITDRFNHMVEHLLKFMSEGNTEDDNLGAIIWALHCLTEAERLSPNDFNKIVGLSNLFSEAATIFHEQEMKERSD